MNYISVQEALKKGKGKVYLRGWVYRERKQKEMIFIVLRDYSNIIQCVIKKDKVNSKIWNDVNRLLVESSVKLTGTIKKEKRAPTGYEVQVSGLEVVDFAEVFPIKKDQSMELLLDKRHLWLRSRRMNAVLKIRSTIFGAIHEYFRKQGYFEHQSPSFTPTACEGGSTLFKVNYFGQEVYLTQSWQLYAEAVVFALEKIYCIAPSFRAEKSKTSRHITEYWHAETEVTWINLSELLELAEGLIKNIIKKVLKENKEELKILGRDIKKLEPILKKKFPRITYTEALNLLDKRKKMKVKWGKDLRTIEEDNLSELYDTPIFVTNYPKEIKAFYMLENPKNKEVVECFDCIAPEHHGEIIGGSIREIDVDKLIERLKKGGEDIKNYDWYLDLRRYGSVPHGGFGLGVERLIKWICGLDNIKDAIAFPRTMFRFKP